MGDLPGRVYSHETTRLESDPKRPKIGFVLVEQQYRDQGQRILGKLSNDADPRDTLGALGNSLSPRENIFADIEDPLKVDEPLQEVKKDKNLDLREVLQDEMSNFLQTFSGQMEKDQ